LALAQLLDCEPLSREGKLIYITLNILQLARLVLFSRATQGRGFASLLHLSTPGSLSVMDATGQLCRSC